MVQEVTLQIGAANLNYHYWEAWEVSAGSKIPNWQKKLTYADQYSAASMPGTKGTTRYTGKLKFFENLTLPKDFVTNNPNTAAGILHATTIKPSFWDGTGTDHNLTITWDCTTNPHSSSITTQPK